MSSAVLRRRLRLSAFAAAPPPGDSSPGALFISKVEWLRLREPASGRIEWLVRIRTRGGLTGYGECGPIDRAGADLAANTLIGRPATAYEWARRQLVSAPGVEAGVTMALLDLIGKHANAPLYQVLGGPTRNRVRALAKLDGATDDEILASLEALRKRGHRAFMVPVPLPPFPNSGQAFVNAVRARMDKLRQAAPPECDFVLDGGGALTAGDAATAAAALERFHLLWFEEPCNSTNTSAIRKIAAETVTPLGFGRDIAAASRFQEMLRDEAIDLLRPSLARNSIVQIRRMAALAETYYVAVAPYHDGGPLGTAAALHLAGALPNFFIQQIPIPADPDDRAFREELAGKSLEEVTDGYAALPTGPGLGVAVSDAAIEKYKERA